MSGPAIVVVAGLGTAWLAFVHEDALVADDYYKQGLAINRILEKEAAAARLGVAARIQFSPDGRGVRVYLTSSGLPPQRLQLRLVHATRVALDQTITLERLEGGWYEARLAAIESGRWTLLLEDVENGWRLTGAWHPALEHSIRLEPVVNN